MWYNECGNDRDVVLSSRVRLARNIKGIPFPGRATEEKQKEVIDLVKDAVDKAKLKELTLINLDGMKDYEKQALTERHLISHQMIDNSVHRALLLNPDNKISVMINEEDHLRIQCMEAGFDLETCFKNANKVDDGLEQALTYAFDTQFGYLTCCPTNVGTGMRASVMVHLPALVMTGTINKITSSLSQLGMTVRGIYGEGSKAVGNIFQISNQVTLGATEEDVLEKFKQIISEVVEQERELRRRIYEKERFKLEDKVMRSYGALKYGVVMTSAEAMKRISDLRLGVSLGILENVTFEMLNEMTYRILPANILQTHNIESPSERDLKRGEIIRNMIK